MSTPGSRQATAPGLSGEGEYLALRTTLLPRDTNYHGTIFGGVILSQIDLAGAGTAWRYTQHNFVTVSMEEVKFLQPVFVGDEISYWGKILKVGRTSICVQVRVEARRRESHELVEVTRAVVTYVAVDEQRRPTPVEPGPQST